MVLLFSVAVPPKILKFCGDMALPAFAVKSPLVNTAKSPPIVVCVPERVAPPPTPPLLIDTLLPVGAVLFDAKFIVAVVPLIVKVEPP